MALPRPSLTQYPVRGGMVRDVARHQIENGVYDAQEVLSDLDGKLRKRGGTVASLGTAQQYFPAQIAAVVQDSAAKQGAIVGVRDGAMDLALYHAALGGTSWFEGAVSTNFKGFEVGKPFLYQEAACFPVWYPGYGNQPPLFGLGGSINTRSAPGTFASLACTSGNPAVTVAVADAAATAPGDYLQFTTTSGAFAYFGMVTRVVSSGTLYVTPTPTFTSTAGNNDTMAIFRYAFISPGDVGLPVSARVGCSFQNRVILGGVKISATGSVAVPRQTRLIWSVLPTESNTPASRTFTGLIQLTAYGFPANNFLDLPELKQIRGVVPLGTSALLVFGVDRTVRITGAFTTITTTGQSLPLDVSPLSNTVGCLTDRSIQETPVGVIWAAQDGVYRSDGSSLENLMVGRIQRFWADWLTDSTFKFYGSALVGGDRYVLSTSKGGLVVDLRTGNWGRYGGPSFSGSTPDPRDPTKTYACARVDPTLATAPAASRDQLFRLDTIVKPDATNARDHDGSPVQASVTTRAMPIDGVDRLKRFRNIVANVDLKSVAAQANGNLLNYNADAELELVLPNADAEFGTIDHWRPFADGATTLPAVTADATTKRSGAYSIKVVTVAATGGGDGCIYDLPGTYADGSTVWSVECWVNLTTAGTVTLTVNGVTATTTTTSSWVQLQVSTRPSSGATSLTVQITHSANSATYYVDDLHVAVLQPVQDRDGAVLLANGSAVHRDTQNAYRGSAGFKVVCSGNANEGVAYFARGTYRANTAYTFSVWAKTISGSTTGGLACGVTGDTATAAITLTSVYKKFSLSWTPTADRTNPEFVVRITAAASGTFACDDFQVAGADPQLDISVVGGIEAEGDWGDGTANDETFANFDVDYEFATGSGTLSVSGGQLVPSSTALKVLLYRRGAGAVKSRDGETVMSYTPGHASDRLVCCLDMYDNANYLFFEANGGGLFSIRKVVGGTTTTLNSQAAPTITLGVQYWLVARRENTLLTIEHWTTDPALGGTPSMTLAHTLNTSDLALFANPGQFGMRITPGDTALRIDAFRCTTYSALTTVAAGNDQPALQRGDGNVISPATSVVYRQYGEASECEFNDVQLRADFLRVGRRT